MKTFEVEVEYESPHRDQDGFPVFGVRSMEVIAVDEANVVKRCERMFGKGNFNIVAVEEISSTIKK
jgi:hypothetical protein